jgi:hypothetical protein
MKFKKTKSEGDIKSDANEWATMRGWMHVGIKLATENGWPDHIYVRRGDVRWVEWKKPGGVLSAQQIERIEQLEQHGAEVRVFDNLEDFKRWMY